MSKWEYAQLLYQKLEKSAEVTLTYLKPGDPMVEGLPAQKTVKINTAFGIQDRDVPTSLEESGRWFLSKIAELGEQGWEMVGAVPETSGTTIIGRGGYSYTSSLVLYFKRPLP